MDRAKGAFQIVEKQRLRQKEEIEKLKKENLEATTMIRPGPGFLPPAPTTGIGRGRPLNGQKKERQMATVGRLPTLPTPTPLPGIGRGRGRRPEQNLDVSSRFSDASEDRMTPPLRRPLETTEIINNDCKGSDPKQDAIDLKKMESLKISPKTIKKENGNEGQKNSATSTNSSREILPKRKTLNFLEFEHELPHGGAKYFKAVKVQEIKFDKNAKPIGILIQPMSKNIVIALTRLDEVDVYSPNFEKIRTLEPERPFKRPSDMTPLAKDEFAVRDSSGINVFKANGDFLKSLDNPKFGLLFGLAYDPGQDHILTINTNGMKNSRDNFSKPGESDILVLDKETGQVVKKIELSGIIKDMARSKCRFLHFDGRKFFIVDLGLNCIYEMTLSSNKVRTFGMEGKKEGQFFDPAGLVTDDMGNLIVNDAGNDRLQVYNSSLEFIGILKIKDKVGDAKICRPSGLTLDKDQNCLYILNLRSSTMVKSKIIGKDE